MYSSLYKHMYWCLAPLQQISQPLNSLEVLVTQLQQSVDHMYEGVGLLSLASEAATRMGGVRITACDSGVVRSMMSLTLEQTALLARCHALPQKGLRTAMNKFREVGGAGWKRSLFDSITLVLCPLACCPLPTLRASSSFWKRRMRYKSEVPSHQSPQGMASIHGSVSESCDHHVT